MFRTSVYYLLNIRFEARVEVAHHIGPWLLAFSNLVKLLFYAGREVVVHDVGEVFNQEVVHHDTNVGRQQFALLVARYLNLCFLSNLYATQRVDSV